MGMRAFVLGSGSSGNALLVVSGESRLLVEAGVPPRLVDARLAELGHSLAAGELDGILASHEHGDHFGQAGRLASHYRAPLHLHRGIGAPVEPPAASRRNAEVSGPASRPTEPPVVHTYEAGRTFRLGRFQITTAIVPHDAAQVAFRIDDGVAALGIATDVGRVTPSLVALLAECDAAIVEANHCPEMLAFSEYPDVVKRRVGGGFGHLSNVQTAELAARLVGSRLGRLWLGHLSRSNNTPSRALEVVATRARRIDVDVLPTSTPVALDIRSTRPHQLGLPFA